MNSSFKKIGLFFSVSSLCACASIVDGKTQNISVQSIPPGAKVYVATRSDGVVGGKTQAGVTPATVSVARKDGVIFLEMEGYESKEVPMNRSMNPWVWGDIVLTSPLSTSIDTSTGASNEFDPGEYAVELTPVKSQ